MTGSDGMGTLSEKRLFLGATAILLFLWLFVGRIASDFLPVRYFLEQDRQVLAGLFAMLLLLVAWTPGVSRRTADRVARAMPGPSTWVAILILITALLWWGTYAVMDNYAMTRDEHMVLFDMAVYAKGRLAEPLAPEWRAYAQALVPAFLLQPVNPSGLVSGYLPGNAWARLAFSRLADPALFNPLLAALGGLALLDVAWRLFDRDRVSVAVAMLLYISSAQMLVNAMTDYAMTAHLALNLVWLAAFLRGGRAGHAVAMIVGAYATGLHQLIFHPLFAAPFLLWKLAKREWLLVLFYGCGYVVAVAGWISFAALAAAQAAPPGLPGANADFLHDRLFPLLMMRDPNTLLLMSYNLARFIAWQNIALLPLAMAAAVGVRRDRDGLRAALIGGPVLAMLVIGFLLPLQGHGWGYRYFHGFIGSFALLGGYGWRALRQGKGERVSAALPTLLLLSPMFTLPWLLYKSHEFVAPYATLDARIAAVTADMVVVDTQAPEAAVDQIRNRPDLTNRPIRLSSARLTPEMITALCERGSVALITRRDMRAVGFAPDIPEASPTFAKLVKRSPCLKL